MLDGFMEELRDDPKSCPMCLARENIPLGPVGSLMYFRCRACGWTFGIPLDQCNDDDGDYDDE